MATQYQQPGQLPEGVVLAHTLYGEPDHTVTHAHTAGNVEPAFDDGVEWIGFGFHEQVLEPPPELIGPEPEPEPEPGPEPEEPFVEPSHEELVGQVMVVSEDVLLPITPRPEPEPVRPPSAIDPTEPESERAKRCKAKNDTCRGWKIKDSDYCAAHSGLLNPRVPRPS